MRCLVILMSLLLTVGGVNAAPDTSSSRIAAVVNNTIISKADLMNRLRFAAISSGLQPTTADMEKMKPQMLRMMIDEQLQLQIGQQFGIEIPDDHVHETIKEIEDSNGLAAGAIAKMLEENKIPKKIFEDQMRAQLVWMIYIREKYPLKSFEEQVGRKNPNHSEFIPSLQIADWEIDQELKHQREKDTQKQYHLAEISLPIDAPEQEAEVKKTLDKLAEELQKGAQFQALAQQFSQSPTASQGGDMGWLTEDQMEPEIRDSVTKLFPGQLSMPIRTSQGYVLVAFVEQRLPTAESQAMLTLQQILLPYPPGITEADLPEVLKSRAGIVGKAKTCAALEKLVREEFPSNQTKHIKNTTFSNLPGPLQNVVAGLDVHQLSEPMPTPDGVVFIMVCEKQAPKGLEFSRDDAIAAITSRKHLLLSRRELRDLRRHAFIDIRM